MHIPVLQKEVLQYLDPKPNENFIDATIDGGGHTTTILGKIKPNGKVLGIEIDPEIYQKLKSKNLDRLVLTNDSYVNLKSILEKNQTGRSASCNSSGIKNFRPVNGILFDLGMSSWHLEESGRGFTFMKDEPLDMRYNIECQNSNVKCQNLTAEKIINEYSYQNVEKILREYGEERFSRRIAKKIVEERKINPIKTTSQLVEIIKRVVPGRTKINPATRTFQALRIAVNDELNNLRKVLPQTIEVLAPGGKIVIISFHSLEDRIVKNFFREEARKGPLRILTKKPIRPSEEEIKINPRSRSAKLRAAMKQ